MMILTLSKPDARVTRVMLFSLGLLLPFLMIWACAPQRIVSIEPVTAESGEDLFSKAEDLYSSSAYEQALYGYQAYLARFPRGPLADAALMKIGTIYELQGERSQARHTYQYLLETFPASPFVVDALIAIMASAYDQGDFEAVVAVSARIRPETMAPGQKLRVWDLVGSSYLIMGRPVDAVYQYLMAYDMAKEEDRKIVRAKLENTIDRMTPDDNATLIDRLKKDAVAGRLLFHLGVIKAEDGEYETALIALSAFLLRFPEHEFAPRAQELIAEVNREAITKPYIIGCLLPLSGPYEAYGQRALKGIELALNQRLQANAAPPFRLIIKDTASDSKRAVQAVTELADQRAAVIIGPIVTAEVAAIEAEIQSIPIITLTQKEDITAIGDYVFRNFITPHMQVEAIVAYAVEDLQIERFAILFPNENYGRTFMQLFWDEVLVAGGKVVGVETYDPDQTDFADPIKRLVGLFYEVPEDLQVDFELQPDETLKAARSSRPTINLDVVFTPLAQRLVGLYDAVPTKYKKHKGLLYDEAYEPEAEEQPIVDFDAIFIPDAPQKVGLIVPQLAFYDVEDIYLLGTNLWHSQNLINMSREYVQGAIMADGFFAESRSEAVQRFVTRFETVFGEKPGIIEATTFDTASMVFQILSHDDIRFRSTLKTALMQIRDFPGVTGRTAFNEQGEAIKTPYLLRVKGGRFIELEKR